jgi:hypothetical protein
MWRALSILLVSAAVAFAQDDAAPPELKTLEAHYDQGKLAKDQALREKYILDLTTLRFKLVKAGTDGWQAVDAEIIRHPGPAQGDPRWTKFLPGTWYSSRHDYLYRRDGSWTMLPADDDATQGTWAIHGNQLIEKVTGADDGVGPPPETIIMINDHLFIATSGTDVFYEKRPLSGGPPLRRDE